MTIPKRRYAFASASCGLFAALCLSACGGSGRTPSSETHRIATRSGTLDAAKLEQAIAASARTERHAKATVECPPAITVKAGIHFYCVAEVGSRNTPFLITERDAKGDVTYRGVKSSQAPLLDSATIVRAIERSIVDARHLPARVTCPTGIPRQRGLQFVCLATIHHRSMQFVVSERDSAGHVRYRAG